MKLKKTIRKVHLWMGLFSSIIVFAICLSGSLFVFSDEIMEFANRDISKVVPHENQLDIDVMVDIVENTFPAHILLHSISYKQRDKATLFVIASKSTGLCSVYVNPYSGNIIGKSRVILLFSLIGHFHKQLLLGKMGSWIVLIASIVFVIELITGFIIWKPKSKRRKYLVKSKIEKRKVPFLRRMIDWHRALGLYFILILFVLVATGVVLFFLPKYGIEAHKHEQETVSVDKAKKALPKATILNALMEEAGVSAVKMELWNADKSPYLQFIVGSKIGLVTFNGSVYLMNKYSGEKVCDLELTRVIKNRNLFRKLHIGDWLGYRGKIISFLSGLIGAFLTLSGLIIWWKKRFKSRR